MFIRCALLLLLLGSPILHSQEIKYVDLTVVEQRTALRHPPAPPPICYEDGTCTGSESHCVGGSVADGAPDRRDLRALGVQLTRVIPTEINPGEPFDAEFRVMNTGLVTLELPISPHLSDLQPGDESSDFKYLSLALVVRASAEAQAPQIDSLGYVELYGSREHGGTLAVLRPGEWIRVKAKISLVKWPLEPTSANLRGEFWLRQNTFHPYPGGSSVEMINVYPNATPAPSVPIKFGRASESKP